MCFQSREKPHMPHAHAHYFGGVTGPELAHAHLLFFFTYPVNGDGFDGHVHDFQGITRYSAQEERLRHFHRFTGRTGPAIALPSGLHYHTILEKVNDEPFIHTGNYYTTIFTIRRHVHTISGSTGIQLGTSDDPLPPPHAAKTVRPAAAAH